MSDPTLQLEDVTVIGENDTGWRFAVGRLGTRWIGFGTGTEYGARARAAFRSEGLEPEPGYMHVFPECSEGGQLGLADRERCIRLTGAIAQDPEHAYGGISRWHVPKALRGRPKDFRCANCQCVGCDGTDCTADYGDYEGTV